MNWVEVNWAEVNWVEILGYVGAALTIASFAMETMIPLRVVALVSNCIFIAYNIAHGSYASLLVNSILLPINVVRLVQMVQLIRSVRTASDTDLSIDWLKPFMTRRSYRRGTILFRKDDTAVEMFYMLTGHYRLREAGIDIPAGQIVGELGLLSPGNRRTQTLECVEDGTVLVIGYDEVRQLYFQNPQFGFYFLNLIGKRLFQDIGRLEARLEERRP